MGYIRVTNSSMSLLEKSGVGIDNWSCNLCFQQGFIYEIETNHFKCAGCGSIPNYIYHKNMIIKNGR